MNTLDMNNGLHGSLFGNILQNILNPASDQSDQLASELYYKDQELAKAKATTTYIKIAAGILGITTAYLGYKQFKK